MAPKRKTPAKNAMKASKPKRTKTEKVEKKEKRVDPVEEKTKAVSNAIGTYFEDDTDVKELLLRATGFSFEKVKEERHHFIAPFHGMIEETLTSFIDRYTAKVETAQKGLETSDEVKANNQVQKDQYEVALLKNKTSITEQKATNEELQAKVEETTAHLQEKEQEASEAIAAAERMQADVDQTEENYSIYKTMRDAPTEVSAKDKKKQITGLQTFLKKSGAPSSLIPSVEVILKKDEHVAFDVVVLNEINRVFDERLQNLRESIAKEREQAEPQLKAKELAQSASDAAEEELSKGEQAMAALKAEGSEISANLKKVDKALKSHDATVKQIQSDLDSHQEELTGLKQVFEDFVFLRERSAAMEEKEDEKMDDEREEKVESTPEDNEQEQQDEEMGFGKEQMEGHDAVMQVV